MKAINFIGRRVIKTGLAVLITAWVCHLFDLPAMFAVITAIVTTEPTAADSLKKGAIRLPAAAIGAALALIFDLTIGPSALTYSLVAMITIVACHHFKLDNGTLVATLTAVAMIPGTSESFFVDFITRLSGTSIGIIVSTLVNFLVLPPKFGPIIYYKIDHLYDKTAEILEHNMGNIDKNPSTMELNEFRLLNKEIDKTFELSEFQIAEWKYRRHHAYEKRSFQFIQEKLDYLQKILFHLGNLCYLKIPHSSFDKQGKAIINQTIHSISNILQDPLHKLPSSHYELMEQVCEHFQSEKKVNIQTLRFEPQSIMLYELLSLHEILMELEEITSAEQEFSVENHRYPKYIFSKRIQRV